MTTPPLEKQDEFPPRRIWFGESCDEWALSPVEGWDEYVTVEYATKLAEDSAKAARAEAFEEAADMLLEASDDFAGNIDAPGWCVDAIREKARKESHE
jgi:hypothetical protein